MLALWGGSRIGGCMLGGLFGDGGRARWGLLGRFFGCGLVLGRRLVGVVVLWKEGDGGMRGGLVGRRVGLGADRRSCTLAMLMLAC